MKDKLIQTFKELVSIDSPSYGEREMAQYLKKRFAELGIHLEEDQGGIECGSNTGNLYAYVKGELPGEPVLLGTHMDTVEPAKGKKAILHEDGRITSDGTTVLGADDLGAVAAVLEAVVYLKKNQIPHKSFELLFTVGEELYCEGAKKVDYSKIRSKYAYALDLTGEIGTAAYAAPTLISFKATVNGKAAHAGMTPEKGIHAIVAAAKAIGQMPQGHIDEVTTANVGTIEGGAGINIVPERCVLRGEIRSMKHETALHVAEEYKKILEETAREAGATAEWEEQIHIKAYETDQSSPVVEVFRQACEKLNIPVELTTTFGGSDNNIFAEHGIEGLVLASAMYQMHSCQEYTTVDGLEKTAKIVVELLKES